MANYGAIYDYAGKELYRDIESIRQILAVFGKKYGSAFVEVELKFRHNIKESFGELEGENVENALKEFLEKTTEAKKVVHLIANCFYTAIGNLSSNYKIWSMVYDSADSVKSFSDPKVGITAVDLSHINEMKDALVVNLVECHKKMLKLESLLDREIELINASLGEAHVKEILSFVREAEKLFLEEKRVYQELLGLLSFSDKKFAYLVKMKATVQY